MSPVVIVVIVSVCILLALAVTFAYIRRLAAERERSVRERFPQARLLLPNVHFFGQQSLGVTQARGNGTLALTDSELYFERWVPRKEYRIPLSAISSIETPTSFLGKTRFRPLLQVNFTNDNGQPDAMAWHLFDLDGAKRAIEAAISSKG